MTSSHMLYDLKVFDEQLGESSSYEDALEAADDEIRRLYASTAQRLRRTRKKVYTSGENATAAVARTKSASPKTVAVDRISSSSNDGSSIERISLQRTLF